MLQSIPLGYKQCCKVYLGCLQSVENFILVNRKLSIDAIPTLKM